jgi:hypothetical protein
MPGPAVFTDQFGDWLVRALKAPRITEAAQRLADQARDAGWTHEEYLAAVLEREVSARNASGPELRIRAAGFPVPKNTEPGRRKLSCHARPSAVEHRPADVVSQPLVINDESADRIGELIALPLALDTPGPLLESARRRTRRLDRIGGRTEFVRRDVRDNCSLTGGIRGMPSGTTKPACRTHRVPTRRTRLRHPDLAARPRPDLFDRLARTCIRGPHRLEQVENVLCTFGRPQGEQSMVVVRERPATADRDEARIAVLGKDHQAKLSAAAHTPTSQAQTTVRWPRFRALQRPHFRASSSPLPQSGGGRIQSLSGSTKRLAESMGERGGLNPGIISLASLSHGHPPACVPASLRYLGSPDLE